MEVCKIDGKEDVLQDQPRKPGVKVRVGSITLVMPEEEDDGHEDRPGSINVVQQSSMIINGFRASQPAGRQDSTEEWY